MRLKKKEKQNIVKRLQGSPLTIEILRIYYVNSSHTRSDVNKVIFVKYKFKGKVTLSGFHFHFWVARIRNMF